MKHTCEHSGIEFETKENSKEYNAGYVAGYICGLELSRNQFNHLLSVIQMELAMAKTKETK